MLKVTFTFLWTFVNCNGFNEIPMSKTMKYGLWLYNFQTLQMFTQKSMTFLLHKNIGWIKRLLIVLKLSQVKKFSLIYFQTIFNKCTKFFCILLCAIIYIFRAFFKSKVYTILMILTFWRFLFSSFQTYELWK